MGAVCPRRRPVAHPVIDPHDEMQQNEIHQLIADVFGPDFFADPRLYPTEGNGVRVRYTGTLDMRDLRGGGGGKGQSKGK